MPSRVQRRRVKGWRMPEGAVYVGRGTHWGNPYRAVREGGFQWVEDGNGARVSNLVCSTDRDGTRAEMVAASVEKFREWLEYQTPMYRDGWLRPLRGKDLACWCPEGQPCHADVLLELANP